MTCSSIIAVSIVIEKQKDTAIIKKKCSYRYPFTLKAIIIRNEHEKETPQQHYYQKVEGKSVLRAYKNQIVIITEVIQNVFCFP